ncbi:AraC family transcriptional regulator [Companilactobacillus sp. RD055328]|uniref:Ada metal-binding domain-containing protein n=1 Tax=Companilactobacillus sp. RD055328 TaxID=2916634 RepID=UPI001FC8590F|nr:Ada metal-binding domain-containing protein [Companilactobacillus sp. RD055328]GKQ42193.1 AraC family transcriptional regulator [Companilactobacillus sp. RD055328]
MSQLRITEKRWQAIINKDSEYDDKFVYARKNSKIFCAPSCDYNIVDRNNIELFNSAKEARAKSYLPCKKCHPMDDRLTASEWIIEIDNILKINYQKDLNLDDIAQLAHGAPYYLHHQYKEHTSKTPLEKLTEIRIAKSKNLLKTSALSIPEVAQEVGINNPAYFSTLFKKHVGQTPLKFRKEHPNNQLSELLKSISMNLQQT